MKRFSLAQILQAWMAAYGENMQTEYPGFIKKLSEEGAPQGSNPSSRPIKENKPEAGKLYALTGGPGSKCIANGNT